MSASKRVLKWWWSWDPETIENWLEQMESQGWHLEKVGLGGIYFTFTKDQPQKVRYCIDYQSSVDPDYQNIFRELGWELVYSGLGWYIWRMAYTSKRPEIFSDQTSLVERNKRIIRLLALALVVQVPSFVSNLSNPARTITALIWVHLLVFGLVLFGIYKINNNNKILQEKKRL